MRINQESPYALEMMDIVKQVFETCLIEMQGIKSKDLLFLADKLKEASELF